MAEERKRAKGQKQEQEPGRIFDFGNRQGAWKATPGTRSRQKGSSQSAAPKTRPKSYQECTSTIGPFGKGTGSFAGEREFDLRPKPLELQSDEWDDLLLAWDSYYKNTVLKTINRARRRQVTREWLLRLFYLFLIVSIFGAPWFFSRG